MQVGALLLALTVGWAPVAQAQGALGSDPGSTDAERLERAREIYDNGANLYEEGRYEAAILAFEQAYDLSGAPLLLYNIANAYERLGELERAVEYLDRYRAFAPPEEAESLRERVRSLERRIDARRAGGEPEEGGAESPAALEPGPDLEPMPAPGDTGPDPIRWALVATAGVGLVTGITFGVLSNRSRDDYESACVDVAGDRICPSSASGDYDAWRRRAITADVGFAVAGAAAVSLLLYELLSGGDDGDVPAVSVAPWATGDRVGISWTGGL